MFPDRGYSYPLIDRLLSGVYPGNVRFISYMSGTRAVIVLLHYLIYLLDNIYIRFGSKLYRQNVGIPMGTNCALLVADLFLFCCERDFMKSLTKEKKL